METHHPEIVVKRLHGEGLHQEADEFAKKSGIQT